MQLDELRIFGSTELYVREMPYSYRYCPRCRREWPAKHATCPQCVHWLGEQPLQRTEWQLAPVSPVNPPKEEHHALVGASAIVLRLVCEPCPSEAQMTALGEIVKEALMVGSGAAACGVTGQGWLVWTASGLRQTFRLASALEGRIVAAAARMEGAVAAGARIRWGIWGDQYLLSFDIQGRPAISEVTARAIFNFEPDNMLLCAEAIYQANRPWEHFVCVPRRRLNGADDFGYRAVGHKRPSALDHAEVRPTSRFAGREAQLLIIDACWRFAGPIRSLAIVGEAGAGKTRLIKEWLARHPEIRAIAASFSLFGGEVADFAGQLAELPPECLDPDAMVQSVVDRVRREGIDAVVLDDLHWAGADGMAFIRRLLRGLAVDEIFVILASRPVGRERMRTLQPVAEFALEALLPPSIQELAASLTASEMVATAAATRSKGNPLFIEQFAAWAAETQFHGGDGGPRTLHQVIAARIDYLCNVRLKQVQQRLRWSGAWERRAIQDELAQLETEIGLWLDRLETGDYADRIDAARHLAQLERLDYNIWLTAMLAGRPQSRSSRLREAAERLLVGSADQVLADLKRRVVEQSVLPENVAREAEHAGDVLSGVFKWSIARQFYELAWSTVPEQREHLCTRLEQCRQHVRLHIHDDTEVYPSDYDLEKNPSLSALDLPHAWIQIARRQSSAKYFQCAAHAAEAINDPALAAWARRKAAEAGGPL